VLFRSDVTVWNRTAAKATAWVEKHAVHAVRSAGSPQEAAAEAELVFLCVGDDADVRAVAEPALGAMTAGSVLVDHTTASATVARELAATGDARGIGFVDAPVSGGQAGAENGALTIMCGGAADAVAKAIPVMKVYAKAITHMGVVGTGQLTKAVNQLCIAGVLQGLAEGVHFAQKAGLDVGKVFQAIGQGAAQSWQMDNRAPTMAKGEFDFGFAVDWMRKDLAIALEAASENGASLPLAGLVDGYYADVQAMGGGRWDTSSLVARLNKPDAE